MILNTSEHCDAEMDVEQVDMERKSLTLPTEIIHLIQCHLHLGDLHKCRLISSQWNDVAMTRLRAFAVLTRRGMQRRWDPRIASVQNYQLWRELPHSPYWIKDHPAPYANPPVEEISIGLHHPDECRSSRVRYQVGLMRGCPPKHLQDFGLPKHLPVLKITLQGSPLFENCWRIEDDPFETPFGVPTPIYGYKVANPHGQRNGQPRRDPYTYGEEAIRPDDLTVQFVLCGYSIIIDSVVETIGKLILYNVPFNYGEVSDNVCKPFYHKVEEMVWILTYPGRCKLGELCNDVGECLDHANSIVDYKVKDLVRLIPPAETSRLKKITLVFKQKDPSMQWDAGCSHSGKRGAWWAEKLLRNLSREFAKAEYWHLTLNFVNLECLSLPGVRRIKMRQKYAKTGTPSAFKLFWPDRPTPHGYHGELDVAMMDARISALMTASVITPGRRLSREEWGLTFDRMTFTTMQEWIESGDAYGVLSERETARWAEYWKLGRKSYLARYPDLPSYCSDEHHYYVSDEEGSEGGRYKLAV